MIIRNGKDKSAKELVRLFRVWYLTNCKQGDKRSGFYCGITNDPETRKTTHEREDHGGKEIEMIVVYECDSVNIATEAENLMDAEGFDIGRPPHPGNGAVADSRFVYLYRKP